MARIAKPINSTMPHVAEDRSTTTRTSVIERTHYLILPAVKKSLIKRTWKLNYERDRLKQSDFGLLDGTLLHNHLPSEKH